MRRWESEPNVSLFELIGLVRRKPSVAAVPVAPR
jgi:hypothetical protein